MRGDPTELPALRGRNPLGFLAALGTLDVVSRHVPTARLSWREGLRAEAVLHDAPGIDEIILLVEEDRARWQHSALLAVDEDGAPAADLKTDGNTLRRWYTTVRDHGSAADERLLQALLAEGAVARNGKSKPTHLHFTAGNQLFLRMVRQLRAGLTGDDVREALQGPWRFESPLPNLRWDGRGQRLYAISGPAPSKKPPPGVPGADWLAFLGLSLLPVANDGGRLLTTGFSGRWERGSFRWPLWQPALSRAVVSSLLTAGSLADLSHDELAVWGVSEIMTAPVRRPGGYYGSFGPPSSNRGAEVGTSLLRPPPSARASAVAQQR